MLPFFYHIYLLQLENYEVRRYLPLALHKPKLIPPLTRKSLVWTSKAKLLFALSVILGLLVLAFVATLFWQQNIIVIVIAIAAALFFLTWLYFLLLSLSVVLISPVDYIMKRQVMRAASVKLVGLPNLKVIAVAGSYGKTTMKELVSSVLVEKYRVIKTPETINTPLGIARLILKDVNADTQFLVVEMGEHYRGDVRLLTKFVKPHLGIITGITEAHIQRFGSLQAIIDTVFELSTSSLSNTSLLLNGDDKYIKGDHAKYTSNHEVEWYSSVETAGLQFDQTRPGISFVLGTTRYNTEFLGKYIVGMIVAAIKVGRRYGLDDEQIKSAIEKMSPIPHRLQPIKADAEVLIIDDSYNGNPEGVQQAIEALGNFQGRRKIYITPGLVETGKRNQFLHEQIGQSLASVADMVLLIRNSATPHIYNGLIKAGFSSQQVIWYKSAKQAHMALPSLLKKGDVVLFQNDWPDNYL